MVSERARKTLYILSWLAFSLLILNLFFNPNLVCVYETTDTIHLNGTVDREIITDTPECYSLPIYFTKIKELKIRALSRTVSRDTPDYNFTSSLSSDFNSSSLPK